MRQWKVLIVLFGAIALVWALFWVLVANVPMLNGWSERGQFGDMFGALNALFSGLALGGVIYALYLQMQELALQREEMAQSRDELRRTADAQSQQVQLLSRQVAAMEESMRVEGDRRRRQAEPQFRYLGAPTTGGRRELGLENHGAQILDLDAKPLGDFKMTLRPQDLLGTRQPLQALISFSGSPPNPVRFVLTFTDIYGDRRKILVEANVETQTAKTSAV